MLFAQYSASPTEDAAEVRCATTADDTLSGLAARDGVTPVAGNRVLAKAQATGSQNGIYIAAAGAWTRADDLPVGGNAAGLVVTVQEGTANADTQWMCTNDAATAVVGTDALVFSSAAVLDSLLVHKAGAETITGVKTMTTPNIAHVRDANGNAGWSISPTAGAINGLVLENSATGVYVSMVPGAPSGSDADITLRIRAKGTGQGLLVNPANTQIRIAWGATGLGFWGAAEAAQPAAEADLVLTVVGDFALPAAPTAAEVTARMNLIENKMNALLAKLRVPGLIAT